MNKLKKKALVLENVSNLDLEMSQFVTKVLEKEYKEVDIFSSLMHADKREIAKRLASTTDVYIQTLFANKDQLRDILSLIVALAKEQKAKYNIHILYGHGNQLLDFLNKTLFATGFSDIRAQIITSLEYINLFEIGTTHTDTTGNKSYFKTFEYSFMVEPIYYFEDLDKFIWAFDITKKSRNKFDITNGVVTYKPNKSWFDKLSVQERADLKGALAEYRAKLTFDLEDEDGIRKYCGDDADEIIEEKKRHNALLEKII